MRTAGTSSLNIGSRLTLVFALLIAVILCGNGLVLWQFQMASIQTERLAGGNGQVIAALQLERNLLLFYHQLDEFAQSEDANQIATEAEPLGITLLEQIKQTKTTLAHLPPQTHVDPAFLPTLDAIETDLPSQVNAITALAKLGEWDVVRIRLASGVKVFESQISNLVKNIDQESNEELRNAVANMRNRQQKIIFVVPITAISTVLVAAFLGWVVTRRLLELRIEERVGERSRIARELHDTLLQGVISASMQLNVAMDYLPEDSPAKPLTTRALWLMGQVIEEGRNTVRGFRSTDREDQRLEEAFSSVPQEFALKEPIEFRVVVEGHPQPLHPVIRDEVYSIGREALVNAFRHSGAGRIRIEIEYTASSLRVFVCDDGCGIDMQILEIGREGHWGLFGMRERAQRIGAKLKISSHTGAGTEVEFRVPGNIAFKSYSPPAVRWLVRLFRHLEEITVPAHDRRVD